MPPSPQTIELDRVLPYLEARVDGFHGPATVHKFSGGQSNPTFRISTPTGQYVLRKQPPGKLLKSAHAVDREYRVMAALADSDVPVPRVFHLCDDRSVLGSLFYVMEYCDGRIFWDASIPEVRRAERGRIFDEMNRVLVTLHKIDVKSAGLEDFGCPGNYFQRQYERWYGQYRASEMAPIEPMERLLDWLGSRLPDDDGRVALVHGDYRLDNLIFDRDEARAIALIDWELATLGHPFADVGYLCMQLRLPQNVGAMSGLRGRNLRQLGVPTESEYVAQYCERAGLEEIENFSFYVAFSFFRLAAIIQGIAKRAADGVASNKNAEQVGQFVRPMAEYALEAIDEA